jgi:hypothetical protein
MNEGISKSGLDLLIVIGIEHHFIYLLAIYILPLEK